MDKLINHRHASPSILALDLGTITGWALLAEGKIVSGSFDTRQLGGADLGVRFLRFRRELLNSFRGVREVFYEEVHRHEGTHAAHIYGGFQAILLEWCAGNSIPCTGLQVAHVKKYATGRGNAKKAQVFAAMVERGFEPVDDNSADALAILGLARQVRAA
jgi:Holliday junction resolvasome RuvABC endonuclease subunit